MSINLNKNAADFTEEDKWCLANMISAIFSLEEPGRLGIKLYLDNVQIRTKCKLFESPEIVTFEHLFQKLLNVADKIEAFFSTESIKDIHNRMNGKYMERVEEQCKEANGNIEKFIKISIDKNHPSNRPYD